MSGKKNVIMEMEEKRSLADVAHFLRDLADKLEGNQLTLQQGNDEIKLTLPDPITLEFELEEKHKKGRVKRQLEIELEWYPDEEEGSISLV